MVFATVKSFCRKPNKGEGGELYEFVISDVVICHIKECLVVVLKYEKCLVVKWSCTILCLPPFLSPLSVFFVFSSEYMRP